MEVWGIDIKSDPNSSQSSPHSPAQQELSLNSLVSALKRGSQSGIMKLRRGYIVALAQLNKAEPSTLSTKAAYCESLLAWVCSLHRYTLVLLNPP